MIDQTLASSERGSGVGGRLDGSPRAAALGRNCRNPRSTRSRPSRRETAYSPIVVAGVVRAIEFMLIALIGTLVYFAYVRPTRNRSLDLCASRSLGDREPAASSPSRPSIFIRSTPSAARSTRWRSWSRPGRSSSCSRSPSSFFAKLDDDFSRVWFASFFGFGLMALLASRLVLYALVRRWMRDGRLTRRTVIVGGGDAGESLIQRPADAAGQRRARDRRVRRPQRRPLARHLRRPDEARHGRRLRRIRAPHPHRSRDRSRCRSRPRTASCRC